MVNEGNSETGRNRIETVSRSAIIPAPALIPVHKILRFWNETLASGSLVPASYNRSRQAMRTRRHIPLSPPDRPQNRRHPCAHPVLPNEPKSPFRVPGSVASPRAKPAPLPAQTVFTKRTQFGRQPSENRTDTTRQRNPNAPNFGLCALIRLQPAKDHPFGLAEEFQKRAGGMAQGAATAVEARPGVAIARPGPRSADWGAGRAP